MTSLDHIGVYCHSVAIRYDTIAKFNVDSKAEH